MQPITPYVLNACLIVKVQASNGIRTRVSALARQYIRLAIRYLQGWAKEVPVSSTLIKFLFAVSASGNGRIRTCSLPVNSRLLRLLSYKPKSRKNFPRFAPEHSALRAPCSCTRQSAVHASMTAACRVGASKNRPEIISQGGQIVIFA